MSKEPKDKKNPKYYDVRITGNGTRLKIIKSLQETVDKLKQTPEWLHDVEGRDETLKVEIWRTSPDAKQDFKTTYNNLDEIVGVKKGYTPTEDEIEEGFHNREAGYESD